MNNNHHHCYTAQQFYIGRTCFTPPIWYVMLLWIICLVLCFFISIVKAVAISVAVTEVRADAGDGGVVGAVEYYGHVVVALVVVELLYVGEHVAFEQAAAYYEECEVYVAVDDFVSAITSTGGQSSST